MVDSNSHPAFIEVRKPSKLESDLLTEVERLRKDVRSLGADVFNARARVEELESPQVGVVRCPECEYEFDFTCSPRRSEASP